jgi:hypothetical protein
MLYINGEAFKYMQLCNICDLYSGERSYLDFMDCNIV